MMSILLAASALALATPAAVPPAQAASLASPARSPAIVPAVKPKEVPSHRRRPPSPAELRVRAANRAAIMEPSTGGYLGGVQVYPYNSGAIYQVLTAPGQVTDIALEPGEVLGDVAAGDTVRWVFGDTTSGTGAAKRTHVLVKPFAAGLSTSLVITTDRRTYHLVLTSTAQTAMAALSWTYPAGALIALKAATGPVCAAPPAAVSGLALGQLRFNYAISGDRPAWRPLRAFDDGRQTYIEFPRRLGDGVAPPLFLVDARGTAELVNYRVEGRYYVVDRIFAAAELRYGLKHQDVVRIARTGEAGGEGRAS